MDGLLSTGLNRFFLFALSFHGKRHVNKKWHIVGNRQVEQCSPKRWEFSVVFWKQGGKNRKLCKNGDNLAMISFRKLLARKHDFWCDYPYFTNLNFK